MSKMSKMKQNVQFCFVFFLTRYGTSSEEIEEDEGTEKWASIY